MTGRHVLLMLAAAAVGLCVLLVSRALDTDTSEREEAAPLDVERPPTPTALRVVPEPAAEPPAPESAPSAEPAAPTASDAPSTAGATGLEEVEEALRELSSLLHTGSSSNEEILAALLRVQAFTLHPPRPPGFEPAPPGPHRAPVPTLLVPDANLVSVARQERWPPEYLQSVLVWRRKAEMLFLEALKLQKVDRAREVNVREAVNIAAAKVLASTANAGLSRKIIRVLESSTLRAKYAVSQELYDESFGALARLGSLDGLEWLREEFTHTKRSPQDEVDQLSAAHRAMVRFDRDVVEGKERYAIVRQMIKTYAPAESRAGEGDGRYEAFWTRIGKGAVEVLQYYAFDPLDGNGKALDTVAQFTDWFRAHKDPRKPPWR